MKITVILIKNIIESDLNWMSYKIRSISFSDGEKI